MRRTDSLPRDLPSPPPEDAGRAGRRCGETTTASPATQAIRDTSRIGSRPSACSGKPRPVQKSKLPGRGIPPFDHQARNAIVGQATTAPPRDILRRMRLQLRTLPTNTRGPLYADQALAALHDALPNGSCLALVIAARKDSVSLCCDCSPSIRSLVENQLYAQYPDCRLDVLADKATETTHATWTADLTILRDLFPIKRYPQFEDSLNRQTADPLTAILTAATPGAESPLESRVLLCLKPASHRRRSRAEKLHRKLLTPFFRRHHRLASVYLDLALSPRTFFRLAGALLGLLARHEHHERIPTAVPVSGTRLHDREERMQAVTDKLGRHLFDVCIKVSVLAPPDKEREAVRKIEEVAGSFGQFSQAHLASFRLGRIRKGPLPRRFRCHRSLLSSEEIATLWHPPTATVQTPHLASVESREFPPPQILPTIDEAHTAVIGLACYRGREIPFGIKLDDRRRHLAMLGKTGMGKSTLLARLASSDIAAGRGVALIDPHGDLAEHLLTTVPKRRTNDVLYFDAGDRSFPIAFNPLALRRPEDRPLVASGVLGAFRKLYPDFWGPRLEHIFRNVLMALLERPDTTLLSAVRMLSDARFRAQVVSHLTDPAVRAFWTHEFAAMHPKLQVEAIAPIQNKVGQLVTSPILRSILGQPKTAIDLRRVMDRRQVLVVNLSKGRIGEDASNILGSLLISSIQLAAMARADVPEKWRADYFLYVDEVQNFATESFSVILSEARKYRLSLIVANQYLAQLDDATLHALFGNLGTLIVFQTGVKDAELLAEQLGSELTFQDLMTLPRYRAYIRLLIDGMPSRPFSIRTLPPGTPTDPKRATIIRNVTRHRYARQVRHVDAEIASLYAS